MPTAYSYLRFSTPEQRAGDSTRRQTEASQAYAAAHGLTLDTELTFEDLGVSAFRGKNAQDGALSAFIEAAEAGRIKKGSYLLVENLDRLSRQAPRAALRQLERIVECGVTVVTLQDNRKYTAEGLNESLLDLFGVLM